MIGQRIKQARLNAGMSANKLAELLKKSRITLYRYENDPQANIPADTIIKLSEIFHTNPGYFLGWTNKIDPMVDNVATRQTQSFFLTEKDTDDGTMRVVGFFVKKDIGSKILLYSQNSTEVVGVSDEDFTMIRNLLKKLPDAAFE